MGVFRALAVVLLSCTLAQAAPRVEVRIAGSPPAARMEPVLDAIRSAFPLMEPRYEALAPSQAFARIAASGEPSPDLLILSTPDLAVQIANEGYARPVDLPVVVEGQWRGEVFPIGYDPAVVVYRTRSVPQDAELDRRSELAEFLETNTDRLKRRVGLVNIGTDHASYAVAAQDALRPEMFAKVASAFGATRTRVYDSAPELLEAMRAGALDVAYNIPLTDVQAWNGDGEAFRVVVPEDDAVEIPLSVLVPRAAAHPEAAVGIVEFLLGEEGRRVLKRSGVLPADIARSKYQQRVAIGPELLVYLDKSKRSRLLENWFSRVIQP